MPNSNNQSPQIVELEQDVTGAAQFEVGILEEIADAEAGQKWADTADNNLLRCVPANNEAANH